MNIKDAVMAALKELIVPDLDKIREGNSEINVRLDLTNKRLDDINLHLADQSRRIDETNKRIDGTNQRIDSVREELTQRIDSVREDLGGKIDKINVRMDRLYEVIVRRDEYRQLDRRVVSLEEDVGDLKQRAAV